MSQELQHAVEAALEAGELLLGYFHSGQIETALKADHTLVTQADLEADRLIARRLHQRYPDDQLLSEELSPENAMLSSADDRAVWIIDPLDGTTNFSLGLPIWGISIARLVGGFPSCASVYFPALNELFTAETGAGAHHNRQTLRIDPERYRARSFFCCCARTFKKYRVEIPYKTRILGSATYNFCCVARGIASIGFEATPKIWDIAGCWLVVREAGGQIQTLHDTQPFPISQKIDYAHQDFPTIAAATAERIAWAMERIHPMT